MDQSRLKRLITAIQGLDPQTLKNAGLTPGHIRTLILQLPRATPAEINQIIGKVEKLVHADLRVRARKSFLAFVRVMWPGFIEGAHIRQMAQAFDDIIEGRKRRIIINMPPRHSKSEMTSYYLPAYFIGRFPHKKIIIATHTADLATSFGRRIRNLMATPEYQAIFPGVSLAEDSKAQGKWNTSAGGEFYAAGVGTNIAGKGADLLVIDDPTSEQDARDGEYNPDVWEKSWQWYLQGPRQRLQPNAAILLVQTRWHLADMTGKALEAQKQVKSEKNHWHVIRFPAIMPSGRVLWPEFWKLEDMEALRDELDPVYWNAQYLQDPTADTAAIVPRRLWEEWSGELPPVTFTLTTVDTAHTRDSRDNKKGADWSAWTTWGIFHHEGMGEDCALMLDARSERIEYPELKIEMLKQHNEMRPDLMIIEAKAAGTPLIQELGRMGLPVMAFTPTRATGDKIRRLRQVSDIFKAGRVFVPDRSWAREVVNQVAEFPRGAHDDFVDTVSMALSFLRRGDYLSIDLPPDEAEDDDANIAEPFY